MMPAYQQRAWDAVRQYMSDDEKKLTNEQWLEYYDNVISNEFMALNSAAANGDNFKRSLVLDGFEHKNSVQIAMN